MGCATSMIKYLLFFFNFLFVIGGIALITCGALLFNGYKVYQDFVELGAYQAPPILMMIVGGIVTIIAMLGCCGALRESKVLMFSYSTLLSVLLIIEIAIAVGIYVYKDDFKTLLQDGMQKSMGEYNNRPEIKEAWDTMQQNLKCCGVNSAADWKFTIPESCCYDKTSGCTNLLTTVAENLSLKTGKVFEQGCLDKALDDLKTDYGIYGAGIVAAIEFFGVIFGCCLGARFGRKRYNP